MYSVGSEMRQRTYQSITTRCFSAVSIGSVSVLSSVKTLVDVRDILEGGGNLKFKPGSVMTSLICPEGVYHAKLPLIHNKQCGARHAPAVPERRENKSKPVHSGLLAQVSRLRVHPC
jgi:hypothetical protein